MVGFLVLFTFGLLGCCWVAVLRAGVWCKSEAAGLIVSAGRCFLFLSFFGFSIWM